MRPLDISNSSASILAIETATNSCSAALLYGGRISHVSEIGNNIHSKRLLPMISTLIEEAGIDIKTLDAVAVGQGPGSFTGLRIGVGVGQGLAYGAGCPMIGVSSLKALAHSLIPSLTKGQVLAGIDARMGEIYWAKFELIHGGLSMVCEPKVSPPHLVSGSDSPLHLVGNAWSEYWDKLNVAINAKAVQHLDNLYPQARDVLEIAVAKFAEYCDALNSTDPSTESVVRAVDFAPVYVRNDVAKKTSKPLPGTRV